MAKEKAIIRSDMTLLQWTLMEMKKNKVGYFMTLPFFILFFIFTVVPVLLSFLLSFTTFNLLEWPTFVFMDNYIRLLLDDDVFIIAIKNTLKFSAITGPGSYLLSMLFAWFINELRPKIRYIVTLMFYAPSTLSGQYSSPPTNTASLMRGVSSSDCSPRQCFGSRIKNISSGL